MNYPDLFVTAFQNLLRNKVRTVLTVLAIFVGSFTLTVTNGLGAGISSYITQQVNNLGESDVITITGGTASSTLSTAPVRYQPGKQQGSVREGAGPAASFTVLTNADIATLKTDPDLTNVRPLISVSPSYIVGPNGVKYQLPVSSIGSGAHLTLAAGSELSGASGYQLLLQNNYPPYLGFSSASQAVGATVTIGIEDATGVIHTVTATVRGVQQTGLIGSSGAVLNTPLTDELAHLGNIGLPPIQQDRYASATATMTGNLISARVTAIKKRLTSMGYTGETVSDRLGSFQSAISTVIDVLDAFAIITLLAASFGIVNTLLMSVQERTKEIGLMKAMGMRSSRIFLLFSTEAVWIGFFGSLLGVLAAEVLGHAANAVATATILKSLPGFSLLSFTPTAIALTMLVIMALAFLAGTLPARRASRLNPIDALRYE